MRLHPQQIPVIACEILQRLTRDGDVEVEPTRIRDAEMECAATMREFLRHESRASESTRAAMERRGYSYARRAAFLAEFLGFQVASRDLRKVSERLVDHLFASPAVKVVTAGEALLGQKILIAIVKKVEDDSPMPLRITST